MSTYGFIATVTDLDLVLKKVTQLGLIYFESDCTAYKYKIEYGNSFLESINRITID